MGRREDQEEYEKIVHAWRGMLPGEEPPTFEEYFGAKGRSAPEEKKTWGSFIVLLVIVVVAIIIFGGC